ncbi:hypothetical protein EB155_13530 [archaeon]|nr:hypothetical protein [archaeon]
MKQFGTASSKCRKVLFLGYDRDKTRLIDALIEKECIVSYTNEVLDAIDGYDLIISYGYRHIISGELIRKANCPIFNMHISYLPFNRGAHPNFWSFYDGTPSGVTIHLLDEGIDTGPIVYQKKINFMPQDDTFEKTYKTLNYEIEKLFLEKIDKILNNNWKSMPQKGKGSLHYYRDLPKNFLGWETNISNEIKRLRLEGLKYE